MDMRMQGILRSILLACSLAAVFAMSAASVVLGASTGPGWP